MPIGDQSYTRPMDRLRNNPSVLELAHQGRGFLTDLSGNHRVQLDWHMNEESRRDKIFRLKVDDKEVYLDLEELTFYTRMF